MKGSHSSTNIGHPRALHLPATGARGAVYIDQGCDIVGRTR
jgi:hypothetical protein